MDRSLEKTDEEKDLVIDTKVKKILIIDDEEDFAEMVKTHLERTGRYIVKAEYMSTYALADALAFKPDLILLDILMPYMDGADVAFQMQNDERTKDTPIIFLTAALRKQETFFNEGIITGHAFVAKPLSMEDLVYHIEKNLSR